MLNTRFEGDVIHSIGSCKAQWKTDKENRTWFGIRKKSKQKTPLYKTQRIKMVFPLGVEPQKALA